MEFNQLSIGDSTTVIYFVRQTLMIYVAMVLIYVFLSTHPKANDTFSGIACKFHIILCSPYAPRVLIDRARDDEHCHQLRCEQIQTKLLTFYFIRLAISKIPHIFILKIHYSVDGKFHCHTIGINKMQIRITLQHEKQIRNNLPNVLCDRFSARIRRIFIQSGNRADLKVIRQIFVKNSSMFEE